MTDMKILPDEVPEHPYTPLPGEVLGVTPINHHNRVVEEGKNMFVTLLTGNTYVGRVERYDYDRVTVGQSEPIPEVLIESAREV